MLQTVSRLISKFSFLIIPFTALAILTSCNDDDEGGGGGMALPSPAVVYLWNTSTTTDGNISGVSGANNTCLSNVSASFPTTVNTHRAVIATSYFDPRDMFDNDPPVQRPDGTVIINSYSNFFNSGVDASNSTIGGISSYWTGLGPTGVPGSNNCSDWTSGNNGINGAYGIGGGGVVDARRFSDNLYPCDTAVRLLCISY